MMHTILSHMCRRRLRSSLACGLLASLAAPPGVRGAEGPERATDGGGCNGGRALPIEGGEGTSEGGTTDEESSESTMVAGECGDGVVDEGEGCDDGNKEDGDGCPSGSGGCVAMAACGDGIVWGGVEACDDGNAVAGDGCEDDCTETVVAECGNGVKEGGEECDDGNTVNEDGCTGMCKAAVCGDGFVWAGMEGCDDGNTSEEDGCPSGGTGQCGALASCGDGFVWAGMEECDDGNGEDVDGCNNDCWAPRWVFITSTLSPKQNGDLGGVPGADAYCQILAQTARLDGTYMAWLSGGDPTSAPLIRFASSSFAGWYMSPTNPPTLVARGWADLTEPNDDLPENYLRAAISIDEHGSDVGDNNAWTNTSAGGTRKGDNHCNGWSTGSSDYFGLLGHSEKSVLGGEWTENIVYECNVGARFYCFQVG